MAQNNNKHQRKRRRTTTRKYQTNKQRKQNTNGRHCDDKMADACVPRRRWKWSAGFLFFFHSTADVPRRSFFFSLFSFFLLFGWSFFIFTFKLISFRFFSWSLFLSILSFFVSLFLLTRVDVTEFYRVFFLQILDSCIVFRGSRSVFGDVTGVLRVSVDLTGF